MRVVVVGPIASSLVGFRGEMLRAMADAGHDVLALGPEADDVVRTELEARGVRYATYPLSRAGLNPVRDLLTVLALLRRFRAWRADAVLVYAPKPVVYGLMAARLARVRLRTAMITGIGSALGGGEGRRRQALARLLRFLYAISLRYAHLVFFQNEDDLGLFRSLGLLRQRQRIVRIHGSGVDLEHYAVAAWPPAPPTFLMIARLIRDKGVREYVEAARRTRAGRPEARFHLLGGLDVNPTAIGEAELRGWQEEGVIEYLGSTDDVRPALAASHVCVLPSYGEGMPRAVLEAMSMGRPILTTDVSGCRDTVEPGVNGYLVPVRDAAALATRMIDMIDGAADLEAMGRASRARAEALFDVHEVNRRILAAMGLDAAAGTGPRESMSRDRAADGDAETPSG